MYIPRPQEVPLLVSSHVITQPPFLGSNLRQRIYWQNSISVWHVIVPPVKLWPPDVYFGAGPSACIVIMFCCFIVYCDDVLLCDFSLCVSGFLPIQTPNCDTMKVAVIFILLFATVLCRPVSYFLCQVKTRLILAELRTVTSLSNYYIFGIPHNYDISLVDLLHFVSFWFLLHLCLHSRWKKLLTAVQRALKKWWVSRETDTHSEREGERDI